MPMAQLQDVSFSSAGSDSSSTKAAGQASASYCSHFRDLLWMTWPLFLGNMLEWYEFGVYGYLEKEMAANFFTGSDDAGWIGFAITFVARPLGGFLLGWVADNWGSRLSVNLSLIGMLFGTVGQGLLPGAYLGKGAEKFGVVALILCRVLQGLSAGGEIGAILCYVMEVSPLPTLGLAVCMISVGSQIAWAFASGFIAVLSSHVGEEAMLAWGWRIPFVIALVPGLVALRGRSAMKEVVVDAGVPAVSGGVEAGTKAADASYAAEGAECQEASRRYGMLYVLVNHWNSVLISFCGAVGIATMWFVPPFWMLSAIVDEHLSSESLWVGNLAQLSGLAVTPLAGWLTDRCGVGLVTFIGAVYFALAGLPTYYWIASDPTSSAAAYVGVGIIFGCAQGFSGANIFLFCGELFPTRIRCQGMAAGYNMSVSFVGGFGPTIAQTLFQRYPELGPGLYFSCTGLFSAAVVLCALFLQRRGLARLTHRRAAPYFGPAAVRGC